MFQSRCVVACILETELVVENRDFRTALEDDPAGSKLGQIEQHSTIGEFMLLIVVSHASHPSRHKRRRVEEGGGHDLMRTSALDPVPDRRYLDREGQASTTKYF